MPLKKIKEPEPVCIHSEHNPPAHYLYEPGTYEYTCPACGRTVVFSIPQIGKQASEK